MLSEKTQKETIDFIVMNNELARFQSSTTRPK